MSWLTTSRRWRVSKDEEDGEGEAFPPLSALTRMLPSFLNTAGRPAWILTSNHSFYLHFPLRQRQEKRNRYYMEMDPSVDKS